jgi:hypothetical protein
MIQLIQTCVLLLIISTTAAEAKKIVPDKEPIKIQKTERFQVISFERKWTMGADYARIGLETIEKYPISTERWNKTFEFPHCTPSSDTLCSIKVKMESNEEALKRSKKDAGPYGPDRYYLVFAPYYGCHSIFIDEDLLGILCSDGKTMKLMK